MATAKIKHNIYIFMVGGRPCGIDVAAIREVKELSQAAAITPVPHAGEMVLGYINTRGSINLVVSLAAALHGQPEQPAPNGLIIYFKPVVGPNFGAYADSVREIVQVEEKFIDRWEHRRPENDSGPFANYVICGICRHGEELIHLLSPQRLYEACTLPV